MKRLGRGWLYDVFDIGDDRVKKVVYSDWARFVRIFFQSGTYSIKIAIDELHRVKEDALRANSYIKTLKNSHHILGSPKFLDELSYEQDRAITIKELLQDSKEPKKLIDEYINLIHETWKYGFADRIFNFSINNGICSDGHLIQLDFNEISTDKNEVMKDLSEKRWLKSYSYKSLNSSPTLQNYYSSQMDKKITSENLESLWKSNLI